MAEQVSSDIFKFMGLRAPQNFAHEKDFITIIRDHRIQQTHLPDEAHSVTEDAEKFSNSDVARYVFELVKEYLEEIESPTDIISLSDHVADNVKGEFSVEEKTQRPMIDEFVALIKQHLVEFDKKQLVTGLNEIVKKYTDNSSGIVDHMEDVVPESNQSAFSLDFEYLFERLYALYVCKRLFPINLEYVIDGLRALHVIRLLRYIDADKPFGALPTPQTGKPSGRGRTDCALRQLMPSAFLPQVGTTANGISSLPKIEINSEEDLAFLFSATPYIHQLFACLLGYYRPFNDIRPIGIGDLLVVKQFLCKYEAGEIAHVENVLKGELKERSHRRLDRTEDIFSTETDKTEETEKELQTTDRFELKNESEKTMQSDLNAELGTSVSGSYGAVEFSANAGVSFSLSTSESRRNTNNFAKDIVDRSVTRIQKRVREERSTRKLYEVEEINKHELNNIKGDKHISGIYRWLDKRYKAQVFNYGKRLMFEFVVPEPAKFIAAAFEQNKKRQSKPDDPPKPEFPDLDISQITNATIDRYGKLYNISMSDFDKMPEEDTISQGVSGERPDNTEVFSREYFAPVPEGFQATQARVRGGIKFNDTADDSRDWPNYFFISIGDFSQDLDPGNTNTPATSAVSVNMPDYVSIGNISNKVPIAVLAQDVLSFGLTVSIKLKPTDETIRKWKFKAYQRIMDVYEKRLAEYRSLLAEYQDKLDGYNIGQGIMIRGRNPRINLDIIKTELKKHCITMIAKQFDSEKNDDMVFDSMKSRKEQIPVEAVAVTETRKVTQTTPAPGTTVTVTETTTTNSITTSSTDIDIPAIDIPEARAEGSIIQFLEQAFEWPQISYLLYPYFWGHMPEKWFEAQKYYDEEDPMYAKFLQAGSARVLIAVRPAYEIAVMHYLCTKKPWNGGPAPGLHHPLYIPIHEELRNQQDDLNGAEPYGDSWDVVVPTSLVYLQESSDLPTYDCNPPVKKKKPAVELKS